MSRVPKNGENKFHGYKYVTEADILDAVRDELAKRHVMLLPSCVDSKAEAVASQGGKEQRLFTVRMRFTAIDGESGEELAFEMYGQGADSLDKAPYKAMTGAEKYAVMKLFLISTGDDPEREEKPASIPPPAGLEALKAKVGSAKPSVSAEASGAEASHDRNLTFAFGNMKGTPLHSLSTKELGWYAGALENDLLDASKAKWHAKAAAQLTTVKAELGFRDAQ